MQVNFRQKFPKKRGMCENRKIAQKLFSGKCPNWGGGGRRGPKTSPIPFCRFGRRQRSVQTCNNGRLCGVVLWRNPPPPRPVQRLPLTEPPCGQGPRPLCIVPSSKTDKHPCIIDQMVQTMFSLKLKGWVHPTHELLLASCWCSIPCCSGRVKSTRDTRKDIFSSSQQTKQAVSLTMLLCTWAVQKFAKRMDFKVARNKSSFSFAVHTKKGCLVLSCLVVVMISVTAIGFLSAFVRPRSHRTLQRICLQICVQTL